MSATREQLVGEFVAHLREGLIRQGLDAAEIEARVAFAAPLFRASIQKQAERMARELYGTEG